MVRITIDEEFRAKLSAVDPAEAVEIVDESGKLLGRFVPSLEASLAGWEPITPVPTEEELEELAKSNEPGISGEELIARLRSRL